MSIGGLNWIDKRRIFPEQFSASRFCWSESDGYWLKQRFDHLNFRHGTSPFTGINYLRRERLL